MTIVEHNEFDGNCSRCKEELDFPLYCKECKVWLCSNCWLPHDVEMMKKQGLLMCPCGEEHEGKISDSN